MFKQMQPLVWPILLIGTLISIAGGAIAWHTYEQGRWQAVDAEISSSALVIGGSKTQRSAQWQLEIEYRYQLNGQNFMSDRFSSSNPPSSSARDNAAPSAQLQSLLKQYAAGSRVTAYVAPNDPQRAILIRPQQPETGVLLLGLAVTGLGLLLKLAGKMH